MALDRTNKDNVYLTGRLIAVTEHYASKRFGPGTKNEMFNHPARLLEAFSHYIDSNDEYYKEIEAVPPVSVYTAAEKSRMMVGYYHQRAAYDNAETSERLRIGRRIAELRREYIWPDNTEEQPHIGMTQAQLAEHCGLQQAHIARIETGRYSVGLDTLAQIAEALGTRIDFVTNK